MENQSETTYVKTIRCSSLDAVAACAGSVLASPSLTIETADEEASSEGRAIHEAAADYVQLGTFDLEAIAVKHGVRVEDINERVDSAITAFESHRKYFPAPQVEAIVESGVFQTGGGKFKLTGTVDVVHINPTTVVFMDYKNGRVTGNNYNQMAGYAYCLWETLGKLDNFVATAIIAYTHANYCMTITFDAEKLKQWMRDLQYNTLSGKESYRPGHACITCGRWASCPARREIIESGVESMFKNNGRGNTEYEQLLKGFVDRMSKAQEPEEFSEEDRSLLEQFIYQLRMISSETDRMQAFIRTLSEKMGAINLPCGQTLQTVEVRRKQIDPVKGMPVLRTLLPADKILGAVKISPTQILSAAGGNKKKQDKLAAQQQITKALTDAGALTTTTFKRLELVSTSGSKNEHGKSDPTE